MKSSNKSQSSKSSETLRNEVSGAQKRKGVSRELEAAPQTKEAVSDGEGKEQEQKEKPPSEKKENIVAISVFVVLILMGVGLLTNWFGLVDKTDDTARVYVPLGNDPHTGSNNASILIIAFSDYECPFCKKGEETIWNVINQYEDDIVYVFKDYPLTNIHENAYNASLAAECAKEQNMFWEYHEHIYKHNNALRAEDLRGYAVELGLDEEQFNECLDTQRYKKEVDQDIESARKAGVSGTPTFFINGIKVVGAQPEKTFIDIINSELESK